MSLPANLSDAKHQISSLNRSSVRKALLTRRRKATPAIAMRASRILAITGLARRRKCNVAGYLPMRGEADPTPVLNALQQAGFRTGIVGAADKSRPLRFYLNPGIIPLTTRGTWGIIVPAKLAPPMRADILLIPAVGVTMHGHRLGMGGGFYDRTLASLRGRGLSKAGENKRKSRYGTPHYRSGLCKRQLNRQRSYKVETIAFVRSVQITPRLPTSIHDARLDAIISVSHESMTLRNLRA